MYKRSNAISFFSFKIEENIFLENKIDILSTINKQFQKLDGIVGHAYLLKDNLLQNSTNPDTYIRNNKSLDGIRLIPSPNMKDQLIIDVEQFPGHFHLVNDLWFGSDWKMWFGKQYFQYISRDVLVSFDDCHENSELADGIISITLYKDILDYDNFESRSRHWAFRKYTGIDEVAHTMMNSPKNENQVNWWLDL